MLFAGPESSPAGIGARAPERPSRMPPQPVAQAALVSGTTPDKVVKKAAMEPKVLFKTPEKTQGPEACFLDTGHAVIQNLST